MAARGSATPSSRVAPAATTSPRAAVTTSWASALLNINKKIYESIY